MKNDNVTETDHPNPIDRNRAILWARDLMQFREWVVLAIKISRTERASADECNELISIGVLGPDNKDRKSVV